MRPPSTLQTTRTRGPAMTGRLAHHHAVIGDQPRPVVTGRDLLDRERARYFERKRAEKARQEREAAELAKAAPKPASLPRFAAPSSVPRFRTAPKPAASAPKPRKLNAAEMERAARHLMSRTGLSYFAAVKAIREYGA